MDLCLDVGNTQIFAGVFAQEKLLLRFRLSSRGPVSSDQIGIFLKSVLRENDLDCKAIERIAICSVVPNLDYSLRSACRKYFSIDPFFLQAGVKTGLQIKYRNPLEVGADRIANAIAGTKIFPQKNMIIVDFGTATTFCVIDKNKHYLGGVIMPGMRLAMEALTTNTSKISAVKIVKPEAIVGRSTAESVQSGLFLSQLAAVEKIQRDISQAYFSDEDVITIGTGGFAHLFESENVFTTIAPDLVLDGLRHCLHLNADLVPNT